MNHKEELHNHTVKIKEMLTNYAKKNDLNVMMFGTVASEKGVDKKTGEICSAGFNHYEGKTKFVNILLQGIIKMVDISVKKIGQFSSSILPN